MSSSTYFTAAIERVDSLSRRSQFVLQKRFGTEAEAREYGQWLFFERTSPGHKVSLAEWRAGERFPFRSEMLNPDFSRIEPVLAACRMMAAHFDFDVRTRKAIPQALQIVEPYTIEYGIEGNEQLGVFWNAIVQALSKGSTDSLRTAAWSMCRFQAKGDCKWPEEMLALADRLDSLEAIEPLAPSELVVPEKLIYPGEESEEGYVLYR